MQINKPRISVCVITYNQENVIKRTLDSLLNQKNYLYEICINDDCSTDRTFEILKEYEHKYPSLIKPLRNDYNLGIFENIEAVWSRPNGDIINIMAGDDEVGEGFFEAVIGFIQEKQIDWENELFCVYGDYKLLYPNGDSFVFSNELVLNKGTAVKYSLLGVVGNRSACCGKRVLQLFQNVSQGRSHIAETAQDIQMPFFAHKFYYLPKVGNIYYAGIGVSTKMSNEQIEEREKIVPYAFDFLRRNGYAIDSTELAYCNYNIAVKRMNRGSGSRWNALFWYLRTYTSSWKVFVKSMKKILFSIKHRRKHINPVIMRI